MRRPVDGQHASTVALELGERRLRGAAQVPQVDARVRVVVGGCGACVRHRGMRGSARLFDAAPKQPQPSASPAPVISSSPLSGCHARSEKRPRLGSRSEHHGLLERRSHTDVSPPAAVARMYGTVEFQDTLQEQQEHPTA